MSSAPGLEGLQNRLPSSSPHKRQGFTCELWNELLHGGVWQDLQAVHPAGAGIDIKPCWAGSKGQAGTLTSDTALSLQMQPCTIVYVFHYLCPLPPKYSAQNLSGAHLQAPRN